MAMAYVNVDLSNFSDGELIDEIYNRGLEGEFSNEDLGENYSFHEEKNIAYLLKMNKQKEAIENMSNLIYDRTGMIV